jgi:hypothetical protein
MPGRRDAGLAPGRRATRRRVATRALARTARSTLAGLLLLWVLLASAAVTAAADPTASPGGGGDVRTNPTAPGVVGDPLFAILGVALVGLVAVVVTLAAVRLADRR